MSPRTRLLLVSGIVPLWGCNRQQSAFAPFGAEARGVLDMTVLLVVGAVVIALVVLGLFVAALRAPPERMGHRGGMRLVLWAGAIVPTIVLAAVLLYALPAMRPLPVRDADLLVRVTGEQFWWRVAYRRPGAAPLITANEVRVPVGRTVAIDLAGGDVIHSFWIPGLAGKMDMIPGRLNRLVVKADRAGRYRGQCTEFCGLSHALMAFDVVALEPAAFDRWLASPPAPLPAATGARLFAANGCLGCHAPGAGSIGPDLTRLAERATVGAGMWPNTTVNVARFIRAAPKMKPGARMPAYPHMTAGEAAAIATYLRGRP